MASGVVLHCGNPPIANNRTPQNWKSSVTLASISRILPPSFLNIGVPRLRQHRKLQDQHGGAGGRDGKKRLPKPCEEIAFVVHVSAPFAETDRTANTMRPCPIHNK